MMLGEWTDFDRALEGPKGDFTFAIQTYFGERCPQSFHGRLQACSLGFAATKERVSNPSQIWCSDQSPLTRTAFRQPEMGVRHTSGGRLADGAAERDQNLLGGVFSVFFFFLFFRFWLLGFLAFRLLVQKQGVGFVRIRCPKNRQEVAAVWAYDIGALIFVDLTPLGLHLENAWLGLRVCEATPLGP